MRVLVAGASGFIGSELSRVLTASGHDVVALVRRGVRASDEVEWHPERGWMPGGVMDEVDAVVNLSGASLARLPWTSKWKREILTSRLRATHTLTAAMRTASVPPSIFLSGSAVGFYGDRPGKTLTEHSSRGEGFLADVVDGWEKAALQAPAGVRTALIRTGLVVGQGGVLSIIELQARLGLAGPLGSGRQFWPWITLPDEVAAIQHLLETPVHGPVNLVAPTPTTAGELIKEFSTQLHRPYLLPVPKPVIALALQDAKELLLADQHIVPENLLESGFTFRHQTAAEAVAWMLSGRAPQQTRHARA